MSEQAEWGGRIVEWARRFHVEYEYQAKRFGWESQTPVDFDNLPEANKQTMLNTVAAVMGSEVYPRERLVEAVTAERDALDLELMRLNDTLPVLGSLDDVIKAILVHYPDDPYAMYLTERVCDAKELETELSELRARVERAMLVSGHRRRDPECAACEMFAILEGTER